jgi:hypothetical protein
MHELPLTGLTFPIKVLQVGLAIDIVHTAIQDASDQPFKGMDLDFAAPAAGLRHGSLLYPGDTVPQSFCVMDNAHFLS